MNAEYVVVVEQGETSFGAYVPDLPGCVAVGETGEVLVRGETVMKGYWNNADATAQAIRHGWLFTGDIARMDEDGFVYHVDRRKDTVSRITQIIMEVQVDFFEDGKGPLRPLRLEDVAVEIGVHLSTVSRGVIGERR